MLEGEIRAALDALRRVRDGVECARVHRLGCRCSPGLSRETVDDVDRAREVLETVTGVKG